jgi:hypothetical protein
MKPIIYLEKDLFTEDEHQDTPTVISKYFDIRDIDLMSVVSSSINPKNILYGRFSLNIAKYLRWNFGYADCLKWLPALRRFTLFPSETMFSDMDFFIKYSQNEDFPLFLRPCDGFKSFSGQVFPTKEKLIEEGNFLKKNKNIDTTLICMWSPVAKIIKEWRTIYVDNQYVSGSQYMENGNISLSSDIPDDVIQFSKNISGNPYFQNIGNFCIDICSTREGYFLLEINSFNCSSFYAADLDKIYSAWSTYYE